MGHFNANCIQFQHLIALTLLLKFEKATGFKVLLVIGGLADILWVHSDGEGEAMEDSGQTNMSWYRS